MRSRASLLLLGVYPYPCLAQRGLNNQPLNELLINPDDTQPRALKSDSGDQSKGHILVQYIIPRTLLFCVIDDRDDLRSLTSVHSLRQ